MTENRLETRNTWPLALLLVLLAGLAMTDLILDRPSDWLTFHVAVEIGVVIVALAIAGYLAVAWVRADAALTGIKTVLAEKQAERDAWRGRTEKTLRGLGEAIDAQMSEWGLTPAEKHTALMLLKGYSHKEIAQLSKRSERTVRQHSVAVYRKSGLAGRAELSAFFLEDLLLPFEGSAGEPEVR